MSWRCAGNAGVGSPCHSFSPEQSRKQSSGKRGFMNSMVSRLGLGPARRVLIAAALPLVAAGCGMAGDRDARAYNTCVMRHAEDALVCEGLLQAYQVDASDFPA